MHSPSIDIVFLQNWRNIYVDKIIRVVCLLGIIAMAASVYRANKFGWLDIYYLHILSSAFVVIACLFRPKIPTNIKCGFIIAVALIAGMTGTFAFGLAASGMIYVVNAAIFAAIFFNKILAFLIILAAAVFLATTGHFFAEGALETKTDLNNYVKDYSAWMSVILGPVAISAALVFVVSHLKIKLINTLVQLEATRKELEHASEHDPLTGLANLRKLNAEFNAIAGHMRRESDPCALLVIDLDDFKKVNDLHGHMAGDELLKEIASRIKGTIRSSDLAARLGGDEFVVLLKSIHDRKIVEEIGQKLIEIINAPFEISPGLNISQGLSIGASIQNHQTHISLESALKDADDSMYKLKAMGKNGFYLDSQSCFQPKLG